MRTISCKCSSQTFHRHKRSEKKGVSTIIGITIFLLIFAIAVSYTFAWNQQVGNYLSAVGSQVNLDQQRVGEKLTVSPINATALTVYNPTVNVIVVDQIRTGGQAVWDGLQAISPYGNWTFATNNTIGNGNFIVITFRGNVFSGGIVSELATSTQRTWQVNWYWNNSNPPATPSLLGSNIYAGQTYWYDLNLAWGWSTYNNPVIGGNISMTAGTVIGFIANATLIKLSDSNSNATINFFNNPNSYVAIGVDGAVPTSWDTTMNITGPLYSTHTVTVYFYGYGTNDTTLKLNIVNATFAP